MVRQGHLESCQLRGEAPGSAEGTQVMFEATCRSRRSDTRSAPKKLRAALAQSVKAAPHAGRHNMVLHPVCAAVYLFFISRKDSAFRSNQSQTTWHHGGEALVYV